MAPTAAAPNPTRWIAASLLGLLTSAATAQMHKVAKPEDVTRAVGVYEWTGDNLAKPEASRFIPVSLFINSKFEDAAIYLARPVPFALQSGNLYELDNAGVPLGDLDIDSSRHLFASDNAATTYDDGWFGYATFIPPAPPKKSNLKPSKTLAVIATNADDDPDTPHFSSKSAIPGSGGAAQGVPTPDASSTTTDPDRPTLHRGTDQSSSSTTSNPPADPDRPTLHRAPDSTQTASTSAPADDPDRPTLRRRTPEDTKKSKNSDRDQAGVEGPTKSLNDDPNRPTLHRGKPGGTPGDFDLPKLAGLPENLHQMVAVSDPKDRPAHNFARSWDDETQHQEILEKMQASARAQLTAYEAANAPPAPATPPPAAKTTTRTRRPAATPPPPPPPPEPLLDEQLKAYTLSYGGTPTYVYSAHTDGLGTQLRYVTIVAQVVPDGEPQIAIKTVTDARHLDRTPWMRLVDAVDAEASNRASLLFELRGQNSRQFALYRIFGARSEQTFATGTTQ
jgi:hypothetical protein